MVRYRKLKEWREAAELYSKIYVLTESFPSEARGLVMQIRRPAAAVFMNIAESIEKTELSYRQECLEHAGNALNEAETQLHLALHYGYMKAADRYILRKFSGLRMSLRLLAEPALAGEVACSESTSAAQPDAPHLEQNDEHADQKVYVPGGFGTGGGRNRQPALAE